MVNYFDGVIPYCNRETLRKVERYMRKYKCSFVEAYNKLFNTNYKYTYEEKLESLSMDTKPR
ncbi:MAG: hypothetical protein ILA19_03230 [Bacilli bacterium]|nr:hypothetical protein [Bacilli bacterium]